MKRIAILLTICLNQAVIAQEFKDSATLHPVEVRATRAGATAPFAKTNLFKREIEKNNLGQDLPFLLNQTPSVVVSSDAGNGIGYTGIRIRGTDASRINITLNGIPFNDAESGGSFFVNLPDFASSVGSIQVQRGVGTSTNGPGAFGGTINMSTHEVQQQPYARLHNSYGSFNSWKHTVMAGTGLVDGHFSTDVRLSRITSDGFIDRATSDLKAFYLSTAYQNQKTNLRFNIFSGKEKTYQAWNGIPEADLDDRRTVNYSGTEKPGAPYENETDNYLQTHFQLFATRKFSDHFSITNGLFLVKGNGYYEQYKAGESYADYGLPDRVTGNDTLYSSDIIRQLALRNQYYGNVLTLQYQKNRSRIDLGAFISWYKGKHIGDVIWASNGMDQPRHQWYNHPATKADASVYLKWQEQLLPSLQLFTDLQFRRVQYDLNGFRNNPGVAVQNRYHFFNPKAGLSYSKNNWLAYASYSIGNKEPNRDDFEAGLHQQPKREQLHDIELGIERKSAKWNWSAGLYYMKYKDQLVLTGMINDVGAYTRTNIPDSYRMGIELQGSAMIRSWLSASANLALSRNKVKNFTEFLDDYDLGGQKTNFYQEADIAYSPAVVGGATIRILPFKGMTADLAGKYVGSQYLDNTSNAGRELDAYFTQDIRLGYVLKNKWLHELELVLQVYNVFDEAYEPNGYTFSYYYNSSLNTENFYFPMAGRNYMVGLNWKF